MRTLFTGLLAFSLVSGASGQQFTGKVAGHSKGEMDVVLTIFGFDKLVKIGTLSADGTLYIDLSQDPSGMLTPDEHEFYIGELTFGFHYVCGNPDDFPEGRPRIARDAGFIALWADEQWSGTLFPVTDERLRMWMEDEGYNDAVEASFFKVLMVTEEVELKKQCGNTDYYNDKNIDVNIEYDIRLKKGLNLVEYKIRSVYPTDPDIRAAFPDKVSITNPDTNPPIIWMASYFW